MRLPGIGGSRRIMDGNTGEMRDVASDKPWDSAFLRRITEANNTIDTATADIRFRIGHVTRQLLAQGKHLTMNAAEHCAVETSIKAMADAFDAVATALEKLRVVSQSEVWVNKDVTKVAQNLAALVHAVSDLDAVRELSGDKMESTQSVLSRCATVLRRGCDVLELVREVTGIELGVNNLGMSADEFKRLAGVKPGGGRDPGPRPEELLGFRVSSVASPEEEQSAGEENCVPACVPEEAQSDVKKCSVCGLDDPPRGEGILPLVDLRDNGLVLCLTCWQDARARQLGHDKSRRD